MRSHRTLVVFAAVPRSPSSFRRLLRPARRTRPRRGGVLLAAIAADAPSLDPHQEETFATLHLVAPCYSTCSRSTHTITQDHRRRRDRVEDPTDGSRTRSKLRQGYAFTTARR